MELPSVSELYDVRHLESKVKTLIVNSFDDKSQHYGKRRFYTDTRGTTIQIHCLINIVVKECLKLGPRKQEFKICIPIQPSMVDAYTKFVASYYGTHAWDMLMLVDINGYTPLQLNSELITQYAGNLEPEWPRVETASHVEMNFPETIGRCVVLNKRAIDNIPNVLLTYDKLRGYENGEVNRRPEAVALFNQMRKEHTLFLMWDSDEMNYAYTLIMSELAALFVRLDNWNRICLSNFRLDISSALASCKDVGTVHVYWKYPNMEDQIPNELACIRSEGGGIRHLHLMFGDYPVVPSTIDGEGSTVPVIYGGMTPKFIREAFTSKLHCLSVVDLRKYNPAHHKYYSEGATETYRKLFDELERIPKIPGEKNMLKRLRLHLPSIMPTWSFSVHLLARGEPPEFAKQLDIYKAYANLRTLMKDNVYLKTPDVDIERFDRFLTCESKPSQ